MQKVIRWSEQEATRREDQLFSLIAGVEGIGNLCRSSTWREQDYKILFTVYKIAIYLEYFPCDSKLVMWPQFGYLTIPNHVFDYLQQRFPIATCQQDTVGYYSYTNVTLD